MTVHKFDTREAASAAAAKRLVVTLNKRLEAQGNASLVVSGGTSPVQCFAELAATDIAWSDVNIVMSDERWLPADHDDSNEKLVRTHLLQGHALGAGLQSMYRDGLTLEQSCAAVDRELRNQYLPFAGALLGMGNDGHFASLFPDAENLDDGLNPDFATLCIPVSTSASPYPRVSLTLSALSRSDEIVLLIFGDEKWQVLQDALSSADAYPVSRLLKQKRAPVQVCWAP